MITISESDHEALAADRDLTVKAFARHLDDFIREQGWQTYGDIQVVFESSSALHTGQFRTRGSVDPDVGRSAARAPAPRNPQIRPTVTPEPGVGPMTQNPGYEPSRDPAEAEPQYARNGHAHVGQDQRYAQGTTTARATQVARPTATRSRAVTTTSPRVATATRPRADTTSRPTAIRTTIRRATSKAIPSKAATTSRPVTTSRAVTTSRPTARSPRRTARTTAATAAQQYGQPGYDHRVTRPRSRRAAATTSRATPSQGYQAQPYGQQGYAEPAYDQGYAAAEPAYDQGYAEAGYQSPAAGRVLTATLQLEDGSGRYYQLREGSNIIGRGQDAQFRLPDTGVSRRHIDIRWDGQVAMLSDLGSTNGTTVNGASIQDWQLADGDIIRAGHSEILVRIL